ncbi:MAG: nitrite reductase small subunit NirD [Gammaproteobacteria bacterium]
MSSDNYIKVAELSDLQEDQGLFVQLDEKPIALFKVGEDEVCAIGNICPHQGGPLSEGFYDKDECMVTCPLHAWDFDVRTGKHVGGTESVPSYQVRLVDNTIEVKDE